MAVSDKQYYVLLVSLIAVIFTGVAVHIDVLAYVGVAGMVVLWILTFLEFL